MWNLDIDAFFSDGLERQVVIRNSVPANTQRPLPHELPRTNPGGGFLKNKSIIPKDPLEIKIFHGA
jgi:hypothetical protein